MPFRRVARRNHKKGHAKHGAHVPRANMTSLTSEQVGVRDVAGEAKYDIDAYEEKQTEDEAALHNEARMQFRELK